MTVVLVLNIYRSWLCLGLGLWYLVHQNYKIYYRWRERGHFIFNWDDNDVLETIIAY